MTIKRTLMGLAATSMLLLAAGCAAPQGSGMLQNSAVSAITDVLGSRNNNSVSAAGADSASHMQGVQGLVNGGKAGMSGAAYGAVGAGALGLADKGMRSAFTALQGESEVGFEDVANMKQNIVKSDTYVDGEGRTCIDYHITVTGGPEDNDQNVTTCQNAGGDWERI
ncbi:MULTISPECIES: hypothetical protein [Halomonadaceae]|jgi:hypothetical protein|nr:MULTISPECIES: hypothetical protein [Halomonas]AJY53077.1 hypothetical protein KO116_P100327 [Halomonas sp. KO116]MBL1270204.1 hypothetical protein [Halomonas sp.]MBL1270641.1 hypothetical protein [Halomonas sp.]MCH4813527.1 hypothetical protein [Halomonas neptunia]NVF16084.1 hypothetical protein [Halomonas maris]